MFANCLVKGAVKRRCFPHVVPNGRGYPVSLAAYILAAIQVLPTFHEDVGEVFAEEKRVQTSLIADAVSDVASNAQGWPGSSRELAALMLTVAWHETRFSLRIHEGRCRPYECDEGRARGLWQLHSHRSLPRERWLALAGVDATATHSSAEEAARALIRSRRMCLSKIRGPDWVAPTLAAFAGRGCGGRLPDAAARVKTFRHLMSIVPKGNAA